MFVLGIDPGLTRCGYAVIEPGPRGGGIARSLGVLSTDPSHKVANRLADLRRDLAELFDDFRPSVVAIERVFFQQNVQTAVSVAQAAGLAMAEGASRGIPVVEYSPNQVKAAVTGDGRADKTMVQSMVQVLLGLSAPPQPADAADAAALALCHLAHDPTGRHPERTRVAR